MHVTIPPFLFQALIAVKNFIPSLGNWIRRPKLRINFAKQTVVFESPNGSEHRYQYFCLTIENRSGRELVINPNTIKLNNELYPALIQLETNYLKSKRWKTCDNDTFLMFANNLLQIHEDNFIFTIKSFEKKTFPMDLFPIRSIDKNSKLFLSSKKICISLSINGRVYYYGINSLKAYKCYINYLESIATNKDWKSSHLNAI